MNKFILIIGLILLAGAAWYVWSTGTSQSPPTETPEIGEPAEVAVTLSEQNDSGESGTATLTDVDGQTRVVLRMEGVPDDLVQPAHIHSGSCAELGGVVYPLSNVGGTGTGEGGSETLVDVSLEQLSSELPLAINVHQSPDAIGVYVACGDLEL